MIYSNSMNEEDIVFTKQPNDNWRLLSLLFSSCLLTVWLLQDHWYIISMKICVKVTGLEGVWVQSFFFFFFTGLGKRKHRVLGGFGFVVRVGLPWSSLGLYGLGCV